MGGIKSSSVLFNIYVGTSRSMLLSIESTPLSLDSFEVTSLMLLAGFNIYLLLRQVPRVCTLLELSLLEWSLCRATPDNDKKGSCQRSDKPHSLICSIYCMANCLLLLVINITRNILSTFIPSKIGCYEQTKFCCTVFSILTNFG